MKQQHNKFRKPWFERIKGFMRLFIKPSEFVYLGEEMTEGGIVLSNHVGTSAPLAWELYGEKHIRFWGAYEMNGTLGQLYRYQTKVFYHEKKHWNLHLARLFCLLASPLTYIFYRGLNLISTYQDLRVRDTLKESFEALENKQNIVIFPEDSTKGYLDELEGFHKGFVLLAKRCLEKGIDAPVYVAYYQKAKRRYIIDKPIKISQMLTLGENAAEISKIMCDRCNELGKM